MDQRFKFAFSHVMLFKVNVAVKMKKWYGVYILRMHVPYLQ